MRITGVWPTHPPPAHSQCPPLCLPGSTGRSTPMVNFWCSGLFCDHFGFARCVHPHLLCVPPHLSSLTCTHFFAKYEAKQEICPKFFSKLAHWVLPPLGIPHNNTQLQPNSQVFAEVLGYMKHVCRFQAAAADRCLVQDVDQREETLPQPLPGLLDLTQWGRPARRESQPFPNMVNTLRHLLPQYHGSLAITDPHWKFTKAHPSQARWRETQFGWRSQCCFSSTVGRVSAGMSQATSPLVLT